MLSNACKYAIRALIYLAAEHNDQNRINIRDLAASIDSPEPFTAKIMQSLARQNIVSSVKGPNGGFYLTQQQLHNKIIDIVYAIDGNHVLTGCGLGLKNCSDSQPCPMHNEYSSIRNQLFKILSNNTIFSLAADLTKGETVLKT
jgi:Rrf2 family iron-sulfur cluster assembly transcriptional regulator